MAEPMSHSRPLSLLKKSPTGIKGFDEIMQGGLPTGRPTLIAGGPGSGKTIFGTEFLVRGALQYDEPGVLLSFEESESDLIKNFSAQGIDLRDLMERKLLAIDYVYTERSEIQEAGDFALDGLFIRLELAITEVGAKRVVLDTIEALFTAFENEAVIRAEIRRLFKWLRDRDLTAIITGELGRNTLTRHGLEEYIADCVIFLDNRIVNQVATRRLRVIKYRGSGHELNEYPFLISNQGISVLPITSLELNYKVSSELVSTGIPQLDEMLGGSGVYKGSTFLISGTSGTGKTSLASTFVNSVCSRGEKSLYVSFEESPDQIGRNMRSIGMDLDRWTEMGLLKFHAVRPTLFGLEMHLLMISNHIKDFNPSVVIMDPISSLMNIGDPEEVKAIIARIIDIGKSQNTMMVLTNLSHGAETNDATTIGISSICDIWIMMNHIESEGEFNRGIYVLKSRGMNHTNQVREFRFTPSGIEILDVFVGVGGKTGAARFSEEAKERAADLLRGQELERLKRQLERKELLLNSRIEELRMNFEAEKEELTFNIRKDELRDSAIKKFRDELLAKRRG